jgi:hypothetical protein
MALPSAAGLADDMPAFRIELKDGTITPMQLEVPANKDIKLEVANTGTTPVEFESKQLRKEKVLGPGVTSVIVIRSLDPGEYQFFDEFHPEAGNATLIAK